MEAAGNASRDVQADGESDSPIEEKKGEDTIIDVKPVDDLVVERGVAPVSREVLQDVFRRAAWYSLALALIVTIIGPE